MILSTGKLYKPKGSLVGAITEVQDGLKSLYALIANGSDKSRLWSAHDFTESKVNSQCSTCGGSEKGIDIDPRKMIAPELSLKHGAVLLWAGTNCGPVEKIKQLAKMLSIVYDKPLVEQDKQFIDILLYGYDQEPVNYTYKKMLKQSFYRGCLFDLKYMRDAGTTSKGNLRAIDYFSGPVGCQECSQRSHYKPESLSIKVLGLSIAEAMRLSIEEMQLFIRELLSTIGLEEWENTRVIIENIEVRLLYFNKIGLRALSPMYFVK